MRGLLSRGRTRLEKQAEVSRNTVQQLTGDNIARERLKGKIFTGLCIFATLFGIVSLAALLIYVFQDAVGWLDWQFITSAPSRFAERAGVYPMIIGSVFVVAMVAVFSLPLGVGAAIYLEEYASENVLKKIIEMNWL